MAIAACLVDTNILLRAFHLSEPAHKIVDLALNSLIQQRTALCYTHQNMAELWNTMTRPTNRNGFDMSSGDAQRQVAAIESGMTFLPDSDLVYREWRKLVGLYGIRGVQVHDARLAASMYVHRVSHILTFNGADFARFTGLTALHPTRM